MSPQPVWGRGPGSGRHATGATPRGRAASAARLAAPSYARFRPVVATRRLTLPVSSWRGRGGRVRRARARVARARHVADSVGRFLRDIRSRGLTRSREPTLPRPTATAAAARARAHRVRRRVSRAVPAHSHGRVPHEYGYSSTDTPKWRRRSCEDVIGVEMKTLPVKTRVPCVCVPPTSRLT